MFRHHISCASRFTQQDGASSEAEIHASRTGDDEITLSVRERAALVVRGDRLIVAQPGELLVAHVRRGDWTWVKPPQLVAISRGEEQVAYEAFVYPVALERRDLILLLSEGLNAALPREAIVAIEARERVAPARALVGEAMCWGSRDGLLAVCITLDGISMRTPRVAAPSERPSIDARVAAE